MKKRTLFRSGAAFLMGLLMTAAVGCFTSFAYDSAWLKACSVENGNSISVTGTATTGALNEVFLSKTNSQLWHHDAGTHGAASNF